MSEALQSRFDAALRLTRQAADMAMRMRPYPGSAHATLKGPQDWVTEADGAVARFLSEQLAIAFPADGFQGEEAGVSRDGSLRWVVDPIDGTSNFARGGTRFCVSVACLEADTPLIGVIVAPALRETITARRDGGARLNGAAVHAAATRLASRAIMRSVGPGSGRTRPICGFVSESWPMAPASAMAGPVRLGWRMSRSAASTATRNYT